MNVQNQVTTHLTLATACALVEEVFEEVAGEEISTHVNGERLYGSALTEVIAVKIQSELATYLP